MTPQPQSDYSPAAGLRLFWFSPAAPGLCAVVLLCAAGAPDTDPLPPPAGPPPLGFLFRGDISPVDSLALGGGGDRDDPFRGDPGAVGIPPVLCLELPSELLCQG